MEGKICGFCRSDRVIEDAVINDVYHSSGHAKQLSTTVGFEKPGSWWDSKPVSVVLKADICCGCGAVTMRVADPEALWEKVSKLPEQESK